MDNLVKVVIIGVIETGTILDHITNINYRYEEVSKPAIIYGYSLVPYSSGVTGVTVSYPGPIPNPAPGTNVNVSIDQYCVKNINIIGENAIDNVSDLVDAIIYDIDEIYKTFL